MLQNQQQQGLMVEDQALGMVGFFSTNPNSNSLASFLPHHHHQFDSFAASPVLPCPIRGGGESNNASSNNSSSALCEALFFSCANNNPKPRHLLHQDPASSFTAVPTHLLSLHQTSNPSWEWGSSGRESTGSKRMFDGDNESVEEDYSDNMNINRSKNNMKMKKNSVGLGMKKVKGVRRKVREPRFSFKTLSDVDVLDDGYKWRKYGQKVVKNTHHPRSYYRCTQDKCRVKKRVERLAEDPRMVITTYEGRHVHSPSLDDDDSNTAHPLLTNFFC